MEGESAGCAVGVENRRQYFDKNWTTVQIELDGSDWFVSAHARFLERVSRNTW
jgi:hypothetical protein